MSTETHTSLKKTVKGSSLMMVGMGGSMVLWFLTRIIIVRTISTIDLGYYSLALTIASVAAMVAALGLQEGSTRFISIFLGEGRPEDARCASVSSMRMSLLSGVIAMLAIIFLAGLIADSILYIPEMVKPLRAIAPFVLCYAVINTSVGVMRGYGDIITRVIFVYIGQPLLFMVFLAVVFGFGMPFISILHALTISMALCAIGALIYLWRRVRIPPPPFGRGDHGRTILAFSLPLLTGSLVAIALNWTDTLMIGRYMQAEDVGVYNVAISLARLLGFPVSALGFVFLPIAADLYAKHQNKDLARTFQVLTKWVFAGTFPVFFALFLFPEMSILLMFGERYMGSASSLSILCAGHLINAFVGSATTILTVMGMTREIMRINFIVLGVNIVLNYLFLKILGFGIEGAAWATTLSFVLYGFLNTMLLYRRSRIHPFTLTYIRPIFGAGAVGLIIYVLAKTLPLNFWSMAIYTLLFLCGYAVSIILTRSIEQEDLDMLGAVSRKTGVDLSGLQVFLSRFVSKTG